MCVCVKIDAAAWQGKHDLACMGECVHGMCFCVCLSFPASFSECVPFCLYVCVCVYFSGSHMIVMSASGNMWPARCTTRCVCEHYTVCMGLWTPLHFVCVCVCVCVWVSIHPGRDPVSFSHSQPVSLEDISHWPHNNDQNTDILLVYHNSSQSLWYFAIDCLIAH